PIESVKKIQIKTQAIVSGGEVISAEGTLTGCVPLQVKFIAETEEKADNYHYRWEVADNEKYAIQPYVRNESQAILIFSRLGTYYVDVTVSDKDMNSSCRSDIIRVVVIENENNVSERVAFTDTRVRTENI
ncbi:MAG: PKD domain-containing protein, partial [Bacteroides sp.]|nr:PKD domain-containing protein [Bacteroides sp.]